MQELRIELQRLTAFEQGLAVQQAETGRLNEILMRMQQAIEDLERKLVQIEDNRRQLAGEIEKNSVATNRAGIRIDEIAKDQQATHARMLVLETLSSKLMQQVADLQSMREEITHQQDELLEAQRRADQARAQTMTEWGRRLENQAHQLEVWADQLRFFGDQHEKNRRVLREVQELAQEVSQQQDRLRQLQRVAEEQIRRELREWQSGKRPALDSAPRTARERLGGSGQARRCAGAARARYGGAFAGHRQGDGADSSRYCAIAPSV